MALFKDMLKAGESIIRDEIVLDYSFIPKLIPFREQQQKYIAGCIKPLFQKRNGKNLFIFGPPGIGKTAAAKHVLRELEEGLDVPKAMPIDRKIEENIVKPHEVIKAEEEIERAIQGIKNYKEKKSIFRSIFRPKEKPKRAGIEELPLPPKFMPKTYEKRDEVDDILNKIHKARNALMEFDLDKAKSAYIEIMRSYNGLSVDKKKKVYQDIKDLYDERKNAEALNIR